MKNVIFHNTGLVRECYRDFPNRPSNELEWYVAYYRVGWLYEAIDAALEAFGEYKHYQGYDEFDSDYFMVTPPVKVTSDTGKVTIFRDRELDELHTELLLLRDEYNFDMLSVRTQYLHHEGPIDRIEQRLGLSSWVVNFDGDSWEAVSRPTIMLELA